MTQISPKDPLDVFKQSYDKYVVCPWCESSNNKVSSPFGGTVSEIIFQCLDCKNTFGWMKWEHKQEKHA